MSKITLYIDVVSPYTFFAFHVLETYRHVWKNVEIEYVPVILGIVMKDSGNRPPIMVKNKAKWLDVDVKRTSAELGLGKFERPPGFPYNSFPAQRALLALKQSENELDFINCARALWRAGWTEHKDMSKPETWVEAFATVIPRSRAEEHVKRANDKDIKEKIIADTKQILEDGSFGLPWFDVTHQGKTERFFGNDRWIQISRFIGQESSWQGFELCQSTTNAKL